MDSSRPLARWLPIAAVIYLVACWSVIIGVTWNYSGLFYVIGIDFSMFHAAARSFVEVGPVSAYDLDVLAGFLDPFWAYYHPDTPELKVRPVPYPPVFHLILIPFSMLPPVSSMLAWTGVNAVLAAIAGRGIASRFGRHHTFTALAIILSVPVAIGLIVGQPVGILLFICYRIYLALERGDDLRAGLWTGLLLLKPQLAIGLLAVLAYKRRWHALAGAALSRGAVALLSLAILGWDGLLVFYRTILGYAAGFHEIETPTAAYHMISWRGAVASLGTGLTESQGMLMTLVLTAITLPLLMIIWRGEWNPRDSHFAMQMLATGIVTVLIGYDMHIHGAVILVGPAAIVILSGQGAPIMQAILRVGMFGLPLIAISLTMLALVLVILMVITLVSILVDGRARQRTRVPAAQAVSNV